MQANTFLSPLTFWSQKIATIQDNIKTKCKETGSVTSKAKPWLLGMHVKNSQPFKQYLSHNANDNKQINLSAPTLHTFFRTPIHTTIIKYSAAMSSNSPRHGMTVNDQFGFSPGGLLRTGSGYHEQAELLCVTAVINAKASRILTSKSPASSST